MGISNRLRPALGRITSSVASTANYGITRVLSFTDSFNGRTSLQLDSTLALAHEHEPAQEQGVVDDAHAPRQITPTIIAAIDVEEPPPSTGDAIVQGHEPTAAAPLPEAETKRVAKAVQTVCLFGASASLLLFINTTPRGGGGVMYRANLGFVCMGLFASLGLSMFSIVARPGGAAVARVQKWGMVMAMASVLVASTLRMVTMLPAASLESAWLAAFVLAGVVAVVYLSLAWKLGAADDDDIQAEASMSACDHESGVAADGV